jgi:hypothetical protein
MRIIPYYLLAIPVFCLASARVSISEPAPSDTFMRMSSECLFVFRNTEYDNRLREGETVTGASVKTRIVLKPAVYAEFSPGVFVRKNFGDSRFLSDARPLLGAKLTFNKFTILLGELLYTDSRHGLPDAILREEYGYDPGVEEGLQFVFNGSMLNQDLWAAYMAANTPAHREHLSIGSHTRFTTGPLSAGIAGYADHYGGQLYAPPGDNVRWNVAGAGDVAVNVPVEGIISLLGADLFLLGSYTDSGGSFASENGWGVLSVVKVVVSDFLCSFGYYKGYDFKCWEGNPLYQALKPYCRLELSRKINFNTGVFLDFGLRLELVEVSPVEYAKNAENAVWINAGWNVSRPLRNIFR